MLPWSDEEGHAPGGLAEVQAPNRSSFALKSFLLFKPTT
jgi:hypothetical protein